MAAFTLLSLVGIRTALLITYWLWKNMKAVIGMAKLRLCVCCLSAYVPMLTSNDTCFAINNRLLPVMSSFAVIKQFFIVKVLDKALYWLYEVGAMTFIRMVVLIKKLKDEKLNNGIKLE